MKNRMHIWALFAVFSAAVLGGMGWISVRLLRVTGENAEARKREWAEREIRSALWRMDAEMSALVLEEASRPFVDYWSFNGPGMVLNQPPVEQVKSLSPSPLLAANAVSRKLYFQAELGQGKAEGRIISPQVLDSAELAKSINWPVDLDDDNRVRLEALNDSLNVKDLSDALVHAEETERQQDAQMIDLREERSNEQQGGAVANDMPPELEAQMQQVAQADQEYAQRRQQPGKVLSQMKQSKERLYNYSNVGSSWGSDDQNAIRDDVQAAGGVIKKTKRAIDAVPVVIEETMRPVWVKGFLLLVRKVDVGGSETIQGVWLNWPQIKMQLLEYVTDVFPDAELVQADPVTEVDKSRMLASLPVKLVPGEPLAAGAPAMPALGHPLGVAWITVVAGVAAAGCLIAGISALSERRAAFVSAVTHELRTPLTTFRMYTEMLKEGMVPDEVRKQEYVETLHSESERLGHLVENVLAYARLEKGMGSRILEEVYVNDLVERMNGALRRRADDAGMELVVDVGDKAGGVVLRTDATAVQQIIFNLVDNACKYASSAADKRIHLAVTTVRRKVIFKVSDHGDGLKHGELRAVFKPFRKSAEKAAQTAAGVGLGLALSRRLARQLSGQLVYEPHRGYGACFCLSLQVMRGLSLTL